MIIDRIREEMTVVAADDRCVGFVNRIEGNKLSITSVSAGYGYDHLVPLAWVSEADKFVYLDKTSGYVTANWESVPAKRARAAAAQAAPVSAARTGAFQASAA